MCHGIKIKRRPIYQLPALLIFAVLCLSADALVEHPAGLAVIAAGLAAAWGLLHLGTEARREEVQHHLRRSPLGVFER